MGPLASVGHDASPRLKVAKPRIALTVAGFDPSSGAGVTADLQTFAAHGLFGTAAVTALTVQSTRGVSRVVPVAADVLLDSLRELQADLAPEGIKLGMLGSAHAVRAVAEFLRQLPPRPQVVLDPVLRSSSGAHLLQPDALAVLKTELLPLVDVVTPNRAELAMLTGRDVSSCDTAQPAMSELRRRYPNLTVVATGGDQAQPVDLIETNTGERSSLAGVHVETTSTHGTGCAFSSALLAGLVQGYTVIDAATSAKRFVEEALRNAPGLGSGHGPMDLLWTMRSQDRLRR